MVHYAAHAIRVHAATCPGLGGCSLLRAPLPLHTSLYLLNRAGSGVVDTATATLVARSSRGKEARKPPPVAASLPRVDLRVANQARSRNLGLIQSTRAGARIVTPVLSGTLFERSCAVPGALPYLLNAACALAVAPIPLALRRSERSAQAPPRPAE